VLVFHYVKLACKILNYGNVIISLTLNLHLIVSGVAYLH
jgi:hypothetical protein